MSITKRRLTVYAVMIVSLIIGINLVKEIIRLNKVDERMSAARQELERAKKEQEELGRALVAADSFWLEKQIRNVLKMAKPDEVVVVIPEEILLSKEADRLIRAEAEEESNPEQWLKVFGFNR